MLLTWSFIERLLSSMTPSIFNLSDIMIWLPATVILVGSPGCWKRHLVPNSAASDLSGFSKSPLDQNQCWSRKVHCDSRSASIDGGADRRVYNCVSSAY